MNKGEPHDCECMEHEDSYMVDAENVYTDKEKEEMLKEGVSWDFSFELCYQCDGIVGMMG
ncbi:hypothetical protein WAF17_16695 [Bernardetia sp. ABR2-2B]|uniref:hypothetical protein n=1 Tax=Bernardetia sp. ABR2-2B TaxID=3127472 RepID=UPI0030D438AE